MTTESTDRVVDTQALKALSHPLRMQLLTSLEASGKATASGLAAELGETSGSTSYHLRQLARHGFIEEVPDEGTARERYWRPHPGGWTLPLDVLGNSATKAATGAVLGALLQDSYTRVGAFLTGIEAWPQEWQTAASRYTWRYDLNAAQLADLHADIYAVLVKHKAVTAGPDARRVHVEASMFPLGRPDDQPGTTYAEETP